MIRCRSLLLLGAALIATVRAVAADVSVFAAASLADALRELAARHQQLTGDTVHLNLAASSTLARQIKEGAPADLFFSADEAKMDELAKAGLIDLRSRQSLLGNTLVVVVPMDSPAVLGSVRDLARADIKHLALAETQTVPAGIYAREYLQKIGLWESARDKVVSTENVRAALAAVESGNAEAGIVYKTDAAISRNVRVAREIPASEGPRISYPAALVKGGRNPAGAGRFFALLTSAEGAATFARYGFLTP